MSRNYYLMIDTETCNTISEDGGRLNMLSVLPYDIGCAVVDKKGNVYEAHSMVISDIFNKEKALMDTAYYRDKLPSYFTALENGEREMVNSYKAKMIIRELLTRYHISAVVAHNARFDVRALNNLERWTTKSKYRFFFPYGTEIYDTLKMAADTIGKQKSYKNFCERYGYMTKHKVPRPRLTAEILYRYIKGDNAFVEEHQGLADVMIEKEIFADCWRQHKKMRKSLYA